MSLLIEFKRRARAVTPPILAACAIAYFGYHALNGDRGFYAWVALKNEIALAEEKKERLSVQRQSLERRVKNLGPTNLDRDLLEEQARTLLNLGRENEVVIFEKSL